MHTSQSPAAEPLTCQNNWIWRKKMPNWQHLYLWTRFSPQNSFIQLEIKFTFFRCWDLDFWSYRSQFLSLESHLKTYLLPLLSVLLFCFLQWSVIITSMMSNHSKTWLLQTWMDNFPYAFLSALRNLRGLHLYYNYILNKTGKRSISVIEFSTWEIAWMIFILLKLT